MTVLYFDCFSGAAGDMLLAALLDAGASEGTVRRCLESLDLSGWSMDVHQAQSAGIRATQVTINTSTDAEERNYKAIRVLLEEAQLPEGVRERALRTFEILALAEARIHNSSIDDVHFHEVGGVDAIVDIVGCAAAIEDLGPDSVHSSGLVTGRGWTTSRHGEIPVPAPAVLEILQDVPIAERGSDELVTPTGAALLKANAGSFGPMPEIEISAVGYGAGRRELAWPNVVRAIVGSAVQQDNRDRAWLIETNIDDMSPELVPYCIEALLQAGASDAWTSPIVMKKGRPAITLSTLVREEHREAALDVLYRETSTLGVRMQAVTKDELEREWVNVRVGDQDVRVKVGIRRSKVVSISPEYEDALLASKAEGIPLREVYERATAGAAERLRKRY